MISSQKRVEKYDELIVKGLGTHRENDIIKPWTVRILWYALRQQYEQKETWVESRRKHRFYGIWHIEALTNTIEL